MPGDEDDFSKPRGNRRLRLTSGVDVHTRMGYGAPVDLQEGTFETCFLSLEPDFLPVLQDSFPFLVPRCASRGSSSCLVHSVRLISGCGSVLGEDATT